MISKRVYFSGTPIKCARNYCFQSGKSSSKLFHNLTEFPGKCCHIHFTGLLYVLKWEDLPSFIPLVILTARKFMGISVDEIHEHQYLHCFTVSKFFAIGSIQRNHLNWRSRRKKCALPVPVSFKNMARILC